MHSPLSAFPLAIKGEIAYCVRMSPLRPYQVTAVSEVRESLAESNRVVLQMPTGAGKTRAATELTDGTGVVWFVCHRREIVRQASAALTAVGVPHAVAAPGYPRDPLARVQVCSVGSMRRRMLRYPKPRKIILDECHHVAAHTWSALLAAFPDAEHIGLTATPTRTDGQGLGNWFDSLVTGPSIAALMEQGYLCQYRLFAPTTPNLSRVRLRRKDYDQAEADRVMRDPRIVGDAVATYLQHAHGKRAVAFANSVAASLELVERFIAAGVPARHVDGRTSAAERDQAVSDLAAGRILVLSNYGVFTEGFDVPAIDAVILLRPTKSLSLYLQMVGRCLRPSPGKEHALILDHAGLVHEHGFPDAAIEWTLAGREAREGGERKKSVMTCPKCGRAHRPMPKCPECGHAYPKAVVRQAVEGELAELRAAAEEREAEARAQEEAERIVAAAMATFVPQAAFGRIIGAGPQKVARMVQDGLPTNERGEVQVSAGLAWVEAQPKRRRTQGQKRAPVAAGPVVKQERKWRWPWSR